TDHLADPPPALDLPTDRPRPHTPTHRGRTHHHTLPATLATGLTTLAHTTGTTLYMTLHTALAVLLSRLTGQHDLIIGTPIANRTHPHLEPLIGFFANTLPIRTTITGNPTYRTLLARTRTTALAAYQHQNLPYEHLVEHLHLDRDLTRNPLFQTMLTLNTALPTFTADGVDVAVRVLSTDSAKFDLTVTVTPGDYGTLHTEWEYATDLFDHATIARVAGHYQTLLHHLVLDPDRPVTVLPLLTPRQRRHNLHAHNPPGTAPVRRAGDPATAPSTVAEGGHRYTDEAGNPAVFAHELIAAHARTRPDDIAIVDDTGQHLTYGQLDTRAGHLAAHLTAHGAAPDTLIGLHTGRGPHTLLAILAVLKTGAAYLPLDPTYPDHRLTQIIDGSNPLLILTQRDHALPSVLIPTHDITALLTTPPPPAPATPRPPLHPEHLAYVIHTSGSTGTPKGVAVTHANLSASTAARGLVYNRPLRGFVLLSSISFDTSVASVFWSLCNGAVLHLPAAGRELDLDFLAARVARDDVSHLVCLPSLYELLLERLAGEDVRLETVVVAGEPLRPSLVERHHELFPDVLLYNEYGPTEATVWSTVARCEPGDPLGRAPIGLPCPGTHAHILDPHGEPTPTGTTGHLYLTGTGLARGYLHQPALTAERFTPNPHGPPGTRIYHTGDLARHRPDHTIDYQGRTDHQVKIRGYRIETTDIDATLTRHPAVRTSHTTVHTHDNTTHLTTYLTLTTPADTDPADTETHTAPAPAPAGILQDLRAHLRTHLPTWMHPTHLV
ncbi:non-ribosomal peptide synthetase, partial [Rhizohabitans arisaemae]|uniref:non-ribosomal peptide synthetase n=1 Tax=Rhizohabitans arisaemae TaxID=2720610 RepID=UPI0024B1E743